mmetsp:Transcript_62238/g.190110  ORF Transcript_62238/g.190110 Transcript_62238/m.190110 type:complete len:323 (+) Transcript_62238:295-1263(+)
MTALVGVQLSELPPQRLEQFAVDFAHPEQLKLDELAEVDGLRLVVDVANVLQELCLGLGELLLNGVVHLSLVVPVNQDVGEHAKAHAIDGHAHQGEEGDEDHVRIVRHSSHAYHASSTQSAHGEIQGGDEVVVFSKHREQHADGQPSDEGLHGHGDVPVLPGEAAELLEGPVRLPLDLGEVVDREPALLELGQELVRPPEQLGCQAHSLGRPGCLVLLDLLGGDRGIALNLADNGVGILRVLNDEGTQLLEFEAAVPVRVDLGARLGEACLLLRLEGRRPREGELRKESERAADDRGSHHDVEDAVHLARGGALGQQPKSDG